MTTITSHIQPVLDAKRIPAALMAAFFVQTAGALFWAGSAAERITVLERTVSDDQSAIEKVAVLEEQTAEMDGDFAIAGGTSRPAFAHVYAALSPATDAGGAQLLIKDIEH